MTLYLDKQIQDTCKMIDEVLSYSDEFQIAIPFQLVGTDVMIVHSTLKLMIVIDEFTMLLVCIGYLLVRLIVPVL